MRKSQDLAIVRALRRRSQRRIEALYASLALIAAIAAIAIHTSSGAITPVSTESGLPAPQLHKPIAIGLLSLAMLSLLVARVWRFVFCRTDRGRCDCN